MAKRSRVERIEVNQKWCKRCGICIAFCPKGVYEKGSLGEPCVSKLEECTECRLCELYCPEYAVTVFEEA